jgi:hypothetical protein
MEKHHGDGTSYWAYFMKLLIMNYSGPETSGRRASNFDVGHLIAAPDVRHDNIAYLRHGMLPGTAAVSLHGFPV